MKKAISIILAALMLMGALSLSSLAANYNVAAGETKDLVQAGDTVEINEGIIEVNNGTVLENFGTVEKNYTDVMTVVSGTVNNFGGSVAFAIGGTVNNFGGTVVFAHGGTVRNFGGTVDVVDGGTVINYKKVTATLTGVTVTGLTEENGEKWVEQGKELVITPNEGFAFEAAPVVTGEAQLKQNDDGSYTVYEIMSDITVEASAVEKKAEEEETNKCSGFFDLLLRFFKLLFSFLKMTGLSKGV